MRRKKSQITAVKPIAATNSRGHNADFDRILTLIESARQRAYSAVNTTLIDLYWAIGEYISRKITRDGWGKGTVLKLSAYIQRRSPGAGGFSSQNIWRML